MIIEELRNDIKNALKEYTKLLGDAKYINIERQSQIKVIEIFLQKNNPIKICEGLSAYVDAITPSLFFWLPFMDINRFINCINTVLQKSKYQSMNLFRTIIQEKEAEIIYYKKIVNLQKPLPNDLSQKMTLLAEDVNSMKQENKYLYTALEKLDSKLITLEVENQNYLARATKAEDELKQLQQQYNNLIQTVEKNSNCSPRLTKVA